MLKELNYKVNGQTLTGESFKMASDTVNEIKVSFAFEGTDWSGLDSIKAVFSSNRIGNSYEVVLTNGSCIIPHEVLAEKGTVSVNLYGSIITGTTLTTRITSYKSACVDVLQKVNVSGSNSVVPTPATWEQELSAHTQNTTVHVTAQNKADWNAKLSDAPSDSKTYGRKNGQWSEVEGGGGSSVWGQITGTLSNQTDLNTALNSKANASNVYTKTESDNKYALITAISDMATKTWVNAQGFITSLAGYATEAWVTAKGYATESWVNAKNYATQSWVEAKGYLTEHQSLAEYRKSADQDTIDSGKVDKVSGKGLSTEDYTSAEKTKLGGIEAGADVTDSANVKDAGATMGVKVAGTELTKDSDGKVNVPLATQSSVGLVKPLYARGSAIASDGTLYAYNEQVFINNRNNSGYNQMFMALGSINHAVKCALSDASRIGHESTYPTTPLTDSEKHNACEVLGAMYDGQYELIEEITLTEDVDGITRTHDTEGNPYNFKAIICKLEAPSFGGAFPGAYGLNINDLRVGYAPTHASAKCYARMIAFIEGGKLIPLPSVSSFASENNANTFAPMPPAGVGETTNAITKFSLTKHESGSVVYPSGTKITIHAIRN